MDESTSPSGEAQLSPKSEEPSPPSGTSSETGDIATSSLNLGLMSFVTAFLEQAEQAAALTSKAPNTPSSSQTPKLLGPVTDSSSDEPGRDFYRLPPGDSLIRILPPLSDNWTFNYYGKYSKPLNRKDEGMLAIQDPAAPTEAIRDVPQEVPIEVKVISEKPKEVVPGNLLIQSPAHTEDIFEPTKFHDLVDRIAKQLSGNGALAGKFDALVGCGNSGYTLCSALSYVLGVPMTIVRKERDRNNHHGRDITGYTGSGRYLIIDDLISSGATVNWVLSEMERMYREDYYLKRYKAGECAGIALYKSNYRGYDDDGRYRALDYYKWGDKKVPVFWVGTSWNFTP